MGQCYARNIAVDGDDSRWVHRHRKRQQKHLTLPEKANDVDAASPAPQYENGATPVRTSAASPCPSPYPHGVAPSSARSTPRRIFGRPLPPLSPAKHIRAAIRRLSTRSPRASSITEGVGGDAGVGEDEWMGAEPGLYKNFGYGKNFAAKYELGKEVGKGHFGHTCVAKVKEGEIKGQLVAVKIISKAKMTTEISIEDVCREVKILKALSGHRHTVKFYDVCEDELNIYIIMELCEGGELLDRILARGGRYTEEGAKVIVSQILHMVAFCHVQGVVHRDLKPENFLFTTKDDHAPLKIIDFGLSDFSRPDGKLNDIVGSAYYVAPEVLHRPFWARTESGIFRSVLRADPNFYDSPWSEVSREAKDFVKRLLNKDYRKRMTAAQALTHPWLRNKQFQIPLDIFMYKLVKSYLQATPFRRAALKALSKALTEDTLTYTRSQFNLLQPSKDGSISLENFRMALIRNATDAMKESRVPDILVELEALSYRKMNFEEFCAATISVYQLEALEDWEQIATAAFEYFEEDGNRVITVEELAKEVNLKPAASSIVLDWIRPVDGKLSLLGYTKFLHGVTIRNSNVKHPH